MSITPGTIISIAYIDPWGTTTPGTFQTGVIVKTKDNPAGTVLAACLVLGATQLTSAVGATNDLARILPAAPLSTQEAYQVWLQWVPTNTTPTWPVASMLVGSLVLPIPAISSMNVSGTNVAGTWTFGVGAGGVSGANLQIFNATTGVSAGFIQAAGGSGSKAINLATDVAYVAYVQSVQPVSAQPQGGFTAPFAYGPWSPPIPIVSAVPTITSVACDGSTVSVAWTGIAVPASPGPSSVAYLLNVVSGSVVVGTFLAGAGGGTAAIGSLQAGADLSIAGQVRFGIATGPLSAIVKIISAVPVIKQTELTQSAGTVTIKAKVASIAGLPSGAVISVGLLQDGILIDTQAASGSPLTASLTTTPAVGSAYALTAWVGLASSQGSAAVSGPTSAPKPIVLAAVAAPTASYDGATLSISWPPIQDPAVLSYQTSVVIGGTTTVTTGPESCLSLPMSLLPGASAAITVQAVSSVGLGLSGHTTYVVAAPSTPSILASNVDGATATLEWTPSVGPGVSGYTVQIKGSDPTEVATDVTLTLFTGLDPTISIVLPFDNVVRSWTATVSARIGTNVSTAATPVTLITSTPVVETVGLTTSGASTVAAVAWSLANYVSAMATGLADAQLRIYVLDGGETIASQSVTFKNATSPLNVTLPATSSRRVAVCAQLVASSQAGQTSAALPVLNIQPTELIASYDGLLASLSWTGGGSGVTGHKIILTPSTGSPIQLETGPETAAQLPLALPWGPTWSASVQPIGPATSGLASAAVSIGLPQLAAPVVAYTRYDGQSVALGWSSAGTGPITYVVNLLSGGTTIASQNAGPALSAVLTPTIPVPTGCTVTVAARIGLAAGPISTAVSVQAATPALSNVTVDSARSVKINWSGSGVTSVQPILFWNGTETTLAAQTTNPATFTLPASAPNGAAVSLRALDSIASGPVAPAVILPTTAPTGLAITYDGTKIHANWDPSPDGFVDGYIATLRVTGRDPAPTPVAGPSVSLAYTPPVAPPNPVATLEVAATAGGSTGPATAASTIVAQTPVLTAAAFDGSTISLTWTPATPASPATATLATLLTGNGVTRTASFPGDTGSLGGTPGPLSVSLQAIGPSTSGAITPPVNVLTAAPGVESIVFDAKTGDCKVTLSLIATATSYGVVVTTDNSDVFTKTIPAPDQGDVSTIIPAATFQAGKGYGLIVNANRTAGGCVATGPTSRPMAIPVRAPENLAVSFDGATVTVSWSPVPDVGVIGYRVSQISGAAKPVTIGETTGTRTRAAVTSWTVTDTIAVQPLLIGLVTTAVTGPAASAPITSLGLFLSTQAGAPYIAPASTSPIAATDIVILLPDLFPTVPATLPSADPFVLSANGPPPQSPWQAGLFYKLTLAAGSTAWIFPTSPPTPVRATLLAAYKTFLAALKTLGATPVAIATVQDAISRAMPQTFAETLVYAYGLAFDQGCFDLRPGMVLRAEYETYQSLGALPDSKYLSGFVTSGVAEYQISSYANGNNWLVGLDAFLANLAAARGTVVTPAPPSAGKAYGGGGVLDAFFTQFQQPFLRLVYAPDVLGNDSTGSAILQRNPVLIGAGNLADLDTATISLRAGQPPGGAVAAFYMRGRTTFSAAIDVLVNGVSQRVPIGSTVGNLLAARAARPPIAGLPLTGVTLTRPTGTAILKSSVTSSYAPGEGLKVRLDWSAGHAYGASSDWLDLPLLHGDRIDLAGGDR